jgi:hypothetical protein
VSACAICAICGWTKHASVSCTIDDTVADEPGSRRIVGFALAGSAAMLVLVATLIYTGVFGVAEQSRSIVAGAMGVAAILDLLFALYFIVSDS